MMRLDEVHIDDYGPVAETLEFGDGLEVVYGPNESGKTLLVDALLFMLTGQNEDDRVGQEPVGYVRVHEGDGVHRLDEGETILDRFQTRRDLALEPREFRNTFVVRSADSTLTQEDDYYDRATDVVAESLVDDIDRVGDAIRDRGKITPTGLLIDRSTDLETRTHHETAVELRNNIESFVEEAHEAGAPSLEAQLLETKQQAAQKRDEVERLEAAKRRREHRDHVGNRDELEEALTEIEEYPDEDDLNALVTDVEAALESVDQTAETRTRRDSAQTLARRAVAATAVAIVASLGVGWLGLSSLGPSVTGFVGVGLVATLAAAVPGAIGVYFWLQRQTADRELEESRGDRTAVLQRGRELGIEADDIEELAADVANQTTHLDELGGDVTEIHGELRGALGLSSETAEETLERATTVLERRASDLEGAEDVEYSEGRHQEALEELEDLEDRVADVRSELERTRDRIESFADDAGDVPFTEYGLDPPATEIETLDGLEALSSRLEAFIATIETDADNARAIDDLLEALKEDEQRRVGDLFFGAESTVSEHFSTITHGRYERVRYEEGANELRVRMPGGEELTPNHLSQSTFDQLYVAVRLAFARKLLDEAPGFLLFDDAFLAADSRRLERQIRILADLVADGWQVVYFTGQEREREHLAGRGDARVHTLEPLE